MVTHDMEISAFCKKQRYSQKRIADALNISPVAVCRAAARGDRLRFNTETGELLVYKVLWKGKL